MQSVRRSTRFRPVEEIEAVLSTDNELDDELYTPSKPNKKVSKIHAKKSTKPTTKTRAKDKSKTTASTTLSMSQSEKTPRTYDLRHSSVSNVNFDMSSDDEVEVSMLSVDQSLKKPMARRGISEARFRKKMGNTSKIVSSTPLEKGARLNYNDLKVRSVQEKTTTIREVRAVMTESISEDTVAQADDEVSEAYSESKEQLPAQKEAALPKKHDNVHIDSPPSWMEVGWKEISLATFLTGIGVIGYICYTTDYCSYC